MSFHLQAYYALEKIMMDADDANDEKSADDMRDLLDLLWRQMKKEERREICSRTEIK